MKKIQDFPFLIISLIVLILSLYASFFGNAVLIAPIILVMNVAMLLLFLVYEKVVQRSSA